MNFKLKPVHLFLGLLAIMLISQLGFGVKEFFENKSDEAGIPKSEIPEGDEHLYILKSEIVPPVCPKCPDVQACEKPKKMSTLPSLWKMP